MRAEIEIPLVVLVNRGDKHLSHIAHNRYIWIGATAGRWLRVCVSVCATISQFA